MMTERTCAIIKPDTYDLRHEIFEYIKSAEFIILRERSCQLTREEAAHFYHQHTCMPIFQTLCEFMSSGLIYVMVLEKENGIYRWRCLIGESNPQRALHGTLRKRYGSVMPRNALHCSANLEDACREIRFFFNPW